MESRSWNIIVIKSNLLYILWRKWEKGFCMINQGNLWENLGVLRSHYMRHRRVIIMVIIAVIKYSVWFRKVKASPMISCLIEVKISLLFTGNCTVGHVKVLSKQPPRCQQNRVKKMYTPIFYWHVYNYIDISNFKYYKK